MRKVRATLILAIAASTLYAQGTERAFEVASVKPNRSGSNRVNIEPQPGGRFTATNVSVMDLIAIAYSATRPFPRSSILGAPSWLASDRFDVLAVADGN